MAMLALMAVAPASASLVSRSHVHTHRLSRCCGAAQMLISVREAEPDFVEDDENLEPGETLVKALKAFDDANSLLCAAALVSRRCSSSELDVHDCWIADSREGGVGPNIQIRGAALTLDKIFLLHLRSGVGTLNVNAGSGQGCTAASHAAARSRGFTRELECADTGTAMLRFEPSIGLGRYRQLRDEEAGDPGSTASAIVDMLEERRRREDEDQGTQQTEKEPLITRDVARDVDERMDERMDERDACALPAVDARWARVAETLGGNL